MGNEQEQEREGIGRMGLEARPNPKCVVAGCGREVTWKGPTVCPEHGGRQARCVVEVQATAAATAAADADATAAKAEVPRS